MKLRDWVRMIGYGLEFLIVWKKNGKVKFLNLWWFWRRNESRIILCKEVLEKSEKQNIPVVLINTGDKPLNRYFASNIFSFSSADWYYDKIIPDFIYDSWQECGIPSFEQVSEEIMNAWKINPLVDKIWWIWNYNTHPSRKVLADIWREYPESLDVYNSSQKGVKWMSLEELVKTYWYLIDVEGNGYSWRLKLLLFSWRPVFVQERLWKDFALLRAKPNKHYVPVKNDFSDLIEKFREVKGNKALYEWLCKNSKKFAEDNLSKDAALLYLRDMFENLEDDSFIIIKIIILSVIKFSKRFYNGLRLFLFKKI